MLCENCKSGMPSALNVHFAELGTLGCRSSDLKI